MKLYHGTSESKARRIIEEGLKPRGDAPANFPVLDTLSEMVYLTTYSATCFARHLASKSNERWAVVEIDSSLLNATLLYPEQVFIAAKYTDEGATDAEAEAALERAANELEANQHLWQASLNEWGGVAYRGVIPLECITRAVTFDPEVNPQMMDKLVAEEIWDNVTYEVTGPRLKAGIKWLFNERVMPLEFFPSGVNALDVPRHIMEEVRMAMINRRGVELIYPKR